MIDLHCHILYGLDDGSQDAEMSEAMLKTFAENKVTAIVASSHGPHHDLALYHERLEEIRVLAQQYNITVYSGCEHSFRGLSADDAVISTMADTKWLLVDMGTLPPGSSVVNKLRSLQNDGYKILLAHPERLWGRNCAEMLSDYADYHWYAQVNCGSLLGRYGASVRQIARDLLDRGLVAVIATDAHRPDMIGINQLRAMLMRDYDEASVERWLVSNPQRMLEGHSPLRTSPQLSLHRKLAKLLRR